MHAHHAAPVWEPSSSTLGSDGRGIPRADAATRRVLVVGVAATGLGLVVARLRQLGTLTDWRTDVRPAVERTTSDYRCLVIDATAGDRAVTAVLDERGVSSRWREEVAVPVVIVTLRAEERVRWLRAGAAGSVTRPVDTEEVVAKVDRLCAQSRGPERPPVLQVGAVVADPADRRLEVGGQAVDIDRTTFDVLVTLLRSPGVTVPFRTIVDEVWDDHHECNPKIIRPHISRIRGVLGRRVLVSSARHVGYRLEVPPDDGVGEVPR